MEGHVEKLFWGLVVEQGKQYKQTPKFNFHVSMAVLDLKNADADPVSVYCQVENGEFILCNLTKNQPQANLDLLFSEGEKIKFYTVGGKGSVHLTGYTMPEDDLGDMMEDEDFSDEESVDSEMAQFIEKNANAKRKNTETMKLTGKDAKKLKANDGKAVESAKPAGQQNQKIIDVDPKQLLNKKQADKPAGLEQKKNPQANQQQQQNKNKQANKLADKNLEVDSDDDDDLSVDEDEESVDLNKLNEMMQDEDSELDDDDLESDDDDDDSEDDLAKLKDVKNKINKSNNQQQQQNKQQVGNFQKKPQQQQQQGGKPNQQKQQNGQFNKQQQFNKTPQQNQNKSNQNTPFNKSQNKHQQTPFHNKNNSNKKGGGGNTPFQHKQGNKQFGSQNKQGKKVFN